MTGVTKNGKVLRERANYSYDDKAKRLTVPFSGATALTVSGATGLFGS